MHVLETHMPQKYPVIEWLDLMELLEAIQVEVELKKNSDYWDQKKLKFRPIFKAFWAEKINKINAFCYFYMFFLKYRTSPFSCTFIKQTLKIDPSMIV